MNSTDKWMQDIMSQKFIDSDISRLIVLDFLCADGYLKNIYKKADICTYLYRVYSDNDTAAHANPNYKIKNIHNYGVDDIKPILDKTLLTWSEYAVNKILMYDSYFVYLNIDEKELNDSYMVAKDILDLFKVKYFAFDCNEPNKLEVSTLTEDIDVDKFGNSIFKNRVLEDMQYCQVCEKTGYKNLRVVHILPAKYCTDKEIIDKNNGLILCKEHAQEYLDGKFYFEENGFIHYVDNKQTANKTHLSVKVKNSERRDYLEKYAALIKK